MRPDNDNGRYKVLGTPYPKTTTDITTESSLKRQSLGVWLFVGCMCMENPGAAATKLFADDALQIKARNTAAIMRLIACSPHNSHFTGLR